MVADAEAEAEAVPLALELLADAGRCAERVANLRRLGRPGAAAEVAKTVIDIANERNEK